MALVFIFYKLLDHNEEENNSNNLTMEKLQNTGDECYKDRIKGLDFINKMPREKNKSIGYISKLE